jgi:hypothetical protein
VRCLQPGSLLLGMTGGARCSHYSKLGRLMGALPMLWASDFVLLIALLPSHTLAEAMIALLIGQRSLRVRDWPAR